MKEVAFMLLRAILPPRDNDSPDAHHNWRWSVSLISLGTTFMLLTHIALACGYISVVHPGFAKTSDLQQLKMEWRMTQEAELEGRILDTKLKVCSANSQVRALYTNSLQKMLVQYTRLTGRAYPLPTCADLM